MNLSSTCPSKVAQSATFRPIWQHCTRRQLQNVRSCQMHVKAQYQFVISVFFYFFYIHSVFSITWMNLNLFHGSVNIYFIFFTFLTYFSLFTLSLLTFPYFWGDSLFMFFPLTPYFNFSGSININSLYFITLD